MKRVQLIVNRSIQYNGVLYTPADPFILPDDEAAKFEMKQMIRVLHDASPKLEDLASLTDDIREALIEKDITSFEDLSQCDEATLLSVDGIGKATAAKILKEVANLSEE